MCGLDIAILLLLGVGAVRGWCRGLVSSLFTLCGFFLGLVAAYMLNSRLGITIAPSLGTSLTVARIVSFFVIWVAVPIALGMVGKMLTGLLEVMQLGLLNRMGGALVGAVKYFAGLTCVVAFCSYANLCREPMSQSVACAFMEGFSRSFIDTMPREIGYGNEE